MVSGQNDVANVPVSDQVAWRVLTIGARPPVPSDRQVSHKLSRLPDDAGSLVSTLRWRRLIRGDIEKSASPTRGPSDSPKVAVLRIIAN